MKHNATGKLEVTTKTNCGHKFHAFVEKEECGDVRVNNILDFRYTIKVSVAKKRKKKVYNKFNNIIRQSVVPNDLRIGYKHSKSNPKELTKEL